MDKLLKLISENANFTSAELAAMLGEPEDAVKAKIKDYEEKGVIKGYQAILNSDVHGVRRGRVRISYGGRL